METENPTTALMSDSEPESTPKKKKSKKSRRADFDSIQGVQRIVISETTQKDIGCLAGDQVTSERPWKYIEKDAVLEHLEFHSESSEFLPVKDILLEFLRPQILVGYIPAETADEDQFYMCLTERATDKVDTIIEKIRRRQQERLNNAINKKVGLWRSLGSEQEVEEVMLKTHRPLMEVEIESKYPILPFKIQFRIVKAQDIRDGYMELRPPEELPQIIYKRRIDANIQVTPFMLENEAQTTCSYPTNAVTQYEYEIPKELTSLELSPELKKLSIKDLSDIYDILQVNGTINLYRNDYEHLVVNQEYTSKIKSIASKEYLCYIDMNLHGSKMIAATSWHPMWTGIVACSYVDIAQSLYRTGKSTDDEIGKAVHDKHPVLCWSFNDELKPKLILETHRDVCSLTFCPYDENLLIGGMVSGQLILWDICNKLEEVERQEILTYAQQNYRKQMFDLMYWMKNIYDVSLVRPTAVSHLQHSHYGKIIGIEFMSPFHTCSKTGKITELDDDEPQSLQIITASEDGSILLWDLKKKPVLTPGGFKAVRKLKRLKKRPSALTVHESPYRMLHLNLRPLYKINVGHVIENSRVLQLGAFYSMFFTTNYELIETDKKITRLDERQKFKAILKRENAFSRPNFYVGTMEGDYLQGTWEGQEFDSGEAVNFETAQFISFGKYHDGPVVLVAYSEVQNAVLTVGGKVFAIWREDFKDRPVVWRKNNAIYTHGSWLLFEQASVRLVRIDGYIETWSLFYKSKTPLRSVLASNGAVNKVVNHRRKIKYDVEGLCDYRGSFRLFYNPHQTLLAVQIKKEQMNKFLSREVKRKDNFITWQKHWNNKYSSQTETTKYVRTVRSQTEVEEIKEELIKKNEKEQKKDSTVSAGVRYLQICADDYKRRKQERMKAIILEKKQLNKEELEKQREPLRKLEEEMEIKRKKQRAKIRDSDKIFKETIVTLFPDVVREKPVLAPDPHDEQYNCEEKQYVLNEFAETTENAQYYVTQHPFIYDFNWTQVLKTGRARRNKLDDSGERSLHKNRYTKIKEERAKIEGETNAYKMSTTIPVEISDISDEEILPKEEVEID